MSKRKGPAKGSFGRFRNKNGKKKKTGNGGRAPSTDQRSSHGGNDHAELYDLQYGELPDVGNSRSKPMSMKSMSKRPGSTRHTMMEEVGYTSRHVESTIRQPLRNKPVLFVKAKEIYDPNKSLREEKKRKEDEENNKNESRPVDDMEEVESLSEEEEEVEVGKEEEEEEEQEEEEEDTIPKEHQELLDYLNSPSLNEVRPSKPRIDILSDSDEEGEEVDEEEDDEEVIEMIQEEDDEEVIEMIQEEEEEELEEVQDQKEHPIGEEKINTEHSHDEHAEVDVQEHNKSEDMDVDSSPFIIDEVGDPELVKLTKPLTSLLVTENDSSSTRSPSIKSDSNPGLEYNPVLTIGKVSLQTSKKNGYTTTELMSVDSLNKVAKPGFVDEENLFAESEESDFLDDDRGGYKDYISQIMRDMANDSDEYESDTNFDIMAESSDEEEEDNQDNDDLEDDDDEETDPKDVEYGFLPEDFEFDISEISVSNVRLGIKNQYYTRCLGLTGSQDESMWIDQDELHDYVISKGVKEHRLQSFMRYITTGLIDDEPFEQPNYSDVYISETSEEEEVQEDEELASMVEFAKSQKQTKMMDIPTTETLKTTGKGKKKKLKLDKFSLTAETLESLQEQHQIRRQSKKNKKDKKEADKLEKAFKKHDLLILYPFSMHITEIREELEAFLHDISRDTLSFPPLDPHGNKTVSKMARFYNMKTTTHGSGLKSFIKASKYRRTFHNLPDYGNMAYVMKQRPIFHRADIKRTKSEITATDGNLKKDKARGRNKPTSNASVQEGDIVGSKAPEIAADNVGRLLLEKLGWVRGEGLGISGNKGISEPITAVVKKSKEGLKESRK
ncbi:protein Sqs1p [[Candida] anglica]|uniref:Protein SQS1 n=1 Tax=[Candida] anglica TaxID=148631 RepID=A0ABP0EB93_9ASCO